MADAAVKVLNDLNKAKADIEKNAILLLMNYFCIRWNVNIWMFQKSRKSFCNCLKMLRLFKTI